jgi:hypothetical protein
MRYTINGVAINPDKTLQYQCIYIDGGQFIGPKIINVSDFKIEFDCMEWVQKVNMYVYYNPDTRGIFYDSIGHGPYSEQYGYYIGGAIFTAPQNPEDSCIDSVLIPSIRNRAFDDSFVRVEFNQDPNRPPEEPFP